MKRVATVKRAMKRGCIGMMAVQRAKKKKISKTTRNWKKKGCRTKRGL